MKKEKILKILSETIKIPLIKLQGLHPDTRLLDIGMTSLLFISFIVKLEEEFNIEVLDSDLIFENFETVSKLFDTLEKYFPHDEPIKKLLILDADNVLWKGISGEEEIVIDDAVMEFQRLLLALYEKGVLLCLCSKNQTSLVEKAFQSPKMLLKREHFTVFLANRQDKASNLQVISQELNLSPDSFVFADDSDYELGFIQLNFPDVECVKIDYEFLDDFCGKISSLFSGVYATTDLNRTQLYREQKEREKEKHLFTSVQEYNDSLKTQITCHIADIGECARLSELSNRTHQFNLSNMQYSREELESFLKDTSHTVLSLAAQDKYGDMGIVGMAVLHHATIEAFMLSCRVFDRDLEHVLLNKIKDLINSPLYGVYSQTDKNKQFADFYSSNGVTII